MDFLLDSNNIPYMTGLAVLAAFFVLELAGLFLGFSSFIDQDSDIDIDHHVDAEFGWDSINSFIGLGRIPIFAWICLVAGVFGIAGLTLNQITTQAFGFFLPILISVPLAVIVTLPIVGQVAKIIARIIPKDETYSVNVDQLVGLEAIVTDVPTTDVNGYGYVFDRYGTIHNISFRLSESDTTSVGSKVALDMLSNQGYFFAHSVA